MVDGFSASRAQRYVSNELSHFVGRGKGDEEQYDLLVNRILKTGWLTHPPHHDPEQPRTVGLDLSKPISTDEMIKYQVVCFCDIPDSDLAIHVVKYSRFGLAFTKQFLIARGACPVFYVANESPVPATELFSPNDFLPRINAARTKGIADRGLYFDTSVRAIIDLLAGMEMLCTKDGNRYFQGLSVSDSASRMKSLLGLTDAQIEDAKSILIGSAQFSKTNRMVTDFLVNYVFSFIKCFDGNRTFEDAANYYMEREWRVANNVKFSLNDVSRVFFPRSYASRFRNDVPAYFGQISFID